VSKDDCSGKAEKHWVKAEGCKCICRWTSLRLIPTTGNRLRLACQQAVFIFARFFQGRAATGQECPKGEQGRCCN
jgi:hypothetical protein